MGPDSDPGLDPDTLLQQASAKGNNRLLHLFTDTDFSISSRSVTAASSHTTSTPKDKLKKLNKVVPETRSSIGKTSKRHTALSSSSSSSAATSSAAVDDGQHSAIPNKPSISPTTLGTSSAAEKPQPAAQQPQPQSVLGDLIDLSDMDPPATQQRAQSPNTDNLSKSHVPDLL